MLEPATGGCRAEIEAASDASGLPGYDTLNRAWLASTLLLLRGFTGHLAVACSAYSWDVIAGHSKRTAPEFKVQLASEGLAAAVHRSKRALPPFKGQILDFHVKFLITRTSREDAVQEVDADWVRQHFDVANRLAAESVPFKFALEALFDWRFSPEPRSAVARLWSGIEAIFGIESELTYRIALLCANLLEEPGRSRKERFQAVKKLYNLRSKVVHGADLPVEKLVAARDDSFALLCALLTLSLQRGHALGESDFDAALFG